MKRVRSYPKGLQDAAASLHRDPTESMSEDEHDDSLLEDSIEVVTSPRVVATQSKTNPPPQPRRRVTIREDLNTELLNWQAPRTPEELEQCFIKVSRVIPVEPSDCRHVTPAVSHIRFLLSQRTDKALFRQDNADCIISYRRRTMELGMDWSDACDHLLGSVRGLEEFQSPHTYHRGSKARKAQQAAVLKLQAKLARRRPLMSVDTKWDALQRVAARYSHESVERALRLAQPPHGYQLQSTSEQRPSLWMKLRSGLLK